MFATRVGRMLMESMNRPGPGPRWAHNLIRVTTQNSVKRIVLNDPKKRNTLSLNMLEELSSELVASSHDKDLRVIVLSAEPPAFSAGHDLKELRSSAGMTHHAKVFSACTHLMTTIQAIQIPVIAEVKGIAAAAGCQLAATCDIVIASEQATFSTPGIVFGLFCATPGVAVSRAVPRKVALDMLLTGDTIDAQQALRAGLVSRVVPHDQVEAETEKVCAKIISLSNPIVALGKTFFYSQLLADTKTAYRYGEKVMLENLRLRDCQEGLTAFTDKRKPVWDHTAKTVH